MTTIDKSKGEFDPEISGSKGSLKYTNSILPTNGDGIPERDDPKRGHDCLRQSTPDYLILLVSRMMGEFLDSLPRAACVEQRIQEVSQTKSGDEPTNEIPHPNRIFDSLSSPQHPLGIRGSGEYMIGRHRNGVWKWDLQCLIH